MIINKAYCLWIGGRRIDRGDNPVNCIELVGPFVLAMGGANPGSSIIRGISPFSL